MVDIVLEYKRVGNLSTGQLVRREGEEASYLCSFQEEAFDNMIRRFAAALQEEPSARGVIQRTDRAGLTPYVLDQRLVAMFRTNPEAAVASMSPGGPMVNFQRKVEEQTPIVTTVRAGFDTLANAFGDTVYSKLKDGKVECPGCGLWSSHGGDHLACRNNKCSLYMRAISLEPRRRWAGLRTKELILLGHCSRFYLPRAWNDGRSWVTREELEQKYNDFQKEKTHVQQ